MKKTFELQPQGKHPDRVLDAIKHELRKYVQRERRKALPAGADFWDFDCRFGAAAEAAQPVHLNDLNRQLDAARQAQAAHCYVEILARPAARKPRAVVAQPASASEPEG